MKTAIDNFLYNLNKWMIDEGLTKKYWMRNVVRRGKERLEIMWEMKGNLEKYGKIEDVDFDEFGICDDWKK